MSRHPGYDAPTCQHEECQPQATVPAPYAACRDAALRWVADAEANAARVRALVAEQPQRAVGWLELLGQYEWMRANAWLHAHGDTTHTRAVRDDLYRRAGLLFAVCSVFGHVRYRRRPSRPAGYAGAGWVEPYAAAILDRMAEVVTEAAAVGMLGELREAAAATAGEQVADVLDPFLPVAAVAGG